MNFVRVTSAEGQSSFLDDEEEKNAKLNAVTCPLSSSDIGNLLECAYSQFNSKNNKADLEDEKAESRNRRMDEATATAVSALRLQSEGTGAAVEIRGKAALHCIPMHKATKKTVVDESKKMARLASVNIYSANWEQRYDLWQKKYLQIPQSNRMRRSN